MEGVELHEGKEVNQEVEQPRDLTEGEKQLLAQLEEQKKTNDRLLAESKENANKYRSIRDKYAAKEKIELEQSENWKERLELEKNERLELLEKHNQLKKTTLKKDLDFTVAKLIDKPLEDGVTIDDVIEYVLKTDMVTVSEDESSFENVKEAYDLVKDSKSFLFSNKKAPMVNAVPTGNAPKDRKLSNKELFENAIKHIIKN